MLAIPAVTWDQQFLVNVDLMILKLLNNAVSPLVIISTLQSLQAEIRTIKATEDSGHIDFIDPTLAYYCIGQSFFVFSNGQQGFPKKKILFLSYLTSKYLRSTFRDSILHSVVPNHLNTQRFVELLFPAERKLVKVVALLPIFW